MEVVEHLAAALIASPVLVYLIFPEAGLPVFLALTAYGISAGVLIDLDHFLLARYYTGDWRHLERALRHPLKISTNCGELVEGWLGENGAEKRLISHSIILVASTSLLFFLGNPNLALLNAGMILAHISGDLYVYFFRSS